MPSRSEYEKKAKELPDALVDLLFEHISTGTERQASQWDALDRKGLGIIALASPILVLPALLSGNLSYPVIGLLSVAGLAALAAVSCVLWQIQAADWLAARQPWVILNDAEHSKTEKDAKRRMIVTAVEAYEGNRVTADEKGKRLNLAICALKIEAAALIAATLLHAACR